MFTRSLDDFNLDWDGLLPDIDVEQIPDIDVEQIEEINNHIGYKMDQQGVKGRMLFSRKTSAGKNLVMRLKDKGDQLSNEVNFWAEQLAILAQNSYDLSKFSYVSHPPSSNKRNYHLATELSKQVASILNIPYSNLFTNLSPRGNRAVLATKLKEEKHYKYIGKQEEYLLMIDDIIHTRKTARSCIALIDNGTHYLRFVFLYG